MIFFLAIKGVAFTPCLVIVVYWVICVIFDALDSFVLGRRATLIFGGSAGVFITVGFS